MMSTKPTRKRVQKRSSNKQHQLTITRCFGIVAFALMTNFFVSVYNVSQLPIPGDFHLFHRHDENESVRDMKKRIRRASAVRSDSADPSASALKNALRQNKVVPYDTVPSILEQSENHYGIVHQLPSIPQRLLMDSDQVNDLTYFLESRERPNVDDHPLYLYNPMLLTLDRELIQPSIISEFALGNVNASVAYIAVFRVSNFANCHGPGLGLPKVFKNYVGLAILDTDLNIMKDPITGQYLDAVIDLNQHLLDTDWKPSMVPSREEKRKEKQWMQDCQMIATNSHNTLQKNQLVMLCNEFAAPVMLQRPGAPHRIAPISDGKHEIAKPFRNKYGTGLQLTAVHPFESILHEGKNLHYFTALDTFGPGFLEVWPGGPHEVLPQNFASIPFFDQHEPVPIKPTHPEPNATFTTLDEHRPGDKWNVLRERDNGSACCVQILWPGSHYGRLLLGISHTKTMKGRRAEENKKKIMYNYVSRVYAFELHPPFNIIAKSGYFCLGFGLDRSQDSSTQDEANQSNNEQIWGAANNQTLTIRNTKFSCPRIHFISGIAEKFGDNSTVIISYGVNDCYPRMIEVSKEFLIELLKPVDS